MTISDTNLSFPFPTQFALVPIEGSGLLRPDGLQKQIKTIMCNIAHDGRKAYHRRKDTSNLTKQL